MNADVVVIGAGTVGAAIGYGLAHRNVDVLVLDGSDRDYRAATANFGLVWLQGKGMDMPAYQRLTRESVDLWPDFNAELSDVSAIDLQYERKGGLTLCLSPDEFEHQRATLTRLHNQLGSGDRDWEMLDRRELDKLIPNVRFGAAVVGASFGRRDGHTNPLRLLLALHSGIVRKGGRLMGGVKVQRIQANGQGRFSIDCGDREITAGRVVIASGLGSKELGGQVGLTVPIAPQRGQILVTERLEAFLPFPMGELRQTRDGTVMIGSTEEDVGFNASTTTAAAAALSANAIRMIPALTDVKLVRHWAALRILTPDSYPIYAESQSHPGAFIALCHSGVTLAAVHASALAEAIASGHLGSSFDPFHQRRFDVSKAA